MAAPDTIERGPTERLQFLDAVRGFALLLMIVNHTGRWAGRHHGGPRYNLIYTSMAVGRLAPRPPGHQPYLPVRVRAVAPPSSSRGTGHTARRRISRWPSSATSS